MDSPINRMIDRAANRKAAQSTKAKAKRTKAMNDQVLSLVHAANETALPERHVTPRAALIVMARAMKELASLPEESRNHGVLREVTKFISLNQKTLLASVSMKHADLLPSGHPLSPLNASLSDNDLRKKYSEWIAADPAIADEARPLVAMAHSLPPESIEREHAFLRLRAMQASAVPAYFKIDDVTALVAAFSSGNSSAARRARVALQWRDRFGRWVEMGRGVNFRFRLSDGSIQVGRGNYVGAGGETRVERTASGTSLVSDFGLVEVSGVPGLDPGLYVVNSNNAAVYKARIPGFAAPVGPSFKDQFDQDIPSVEDFAATRKDLPLGWQRQGAFYVSDDNYAVIPGPGGQPQSVLRMNAEGRPAGDAVARVRNWSDVNLAIEKDQPEFDKEIARLESDKLPLGRIPGATDADLVDAADILRMQEQRAKENEAFDAAQPAAEELGGKDLNGNVVPEGWTRDANDDRAYTRQLPLRDGGTYPVIARLNEDGTYIAGHSGGWIPEPGTDGRGPSRKFTSWDGIELEGLPYFVEYLNETFTKNNPIKFTPTVKETKNVKGFDVPKDAKLVAMEQNGDAVVVRMPDGSLVQYDTGGPEGIPYTEEQKQKFISDIKSDETIWFDEEGRRNWKALLEGDSGKRPAGMKLDFADPEQAAEDAGLPEDAPFSEIVQAWFDQNIKPVAPTAKLDGFEEGGITPSVSISADNEEDLLKAFRVYFGDDEATMQDLRDSSEPFTPSAARDSSGDLTEIDKSTLDALDKRMREDSTGEYSMEGVIFSSDNNGDIIMYPDGWEPGDKIIGRIEDDGGIDWESDEQYDKYADNVREALRGMGSGPGEPPTPPSGGGGGDDGDGGKPVTHADAVKIAEDSTLTPSQKVHELFKNAKGMPLRDYIATNELFQDRPIDPALDIDNAEVVEVDGDGQNLLVRYPDNTYYSVDAGSYAEIDGVDHIGVIGIDALGADAVNDYFKNLLDTEDTSMSPFYRGYWIDEDFQRSFLESYPNNEPSAPPSGNNQSFDMSVAQRFIDERFSESGIDLVGTTREGLNSYMILSIPDAKLEDFKDNSGFDDFEDEENFTKLPDGTYKLYTDFSELNANLDSPISDSSTSSSDNQTFDMGVAQRFIDERFAESNIDLVGTTREGRNSYMILNIPEDELEDFKDTSGFDDFEDEENFVQLPDGTYKLYVDFSELNANLDNSIGPDGEPPSGPFSYDEAKKIALDSSKSAQERYAAVFDNAEGRDLIEYVKRQGRGEPDPSIPEGTEIVFNDGDGQSLTIRFPDGTYHFIDTGATDENGIIPAVSVDDFEDDVTSEFLSGLFELDGLPYYRGGFIDDARQREIQAGNDGGSGSGPGEPPSGPTTPSGDYGSDFTDMVVDGAESQFFMDRELEEMLDNDAKEAGIEFTDQLWQAADDRFDLQDQFDQDRLDGLSKEEFIEAAMNKFDANLDATIESAFNARRDLEDDESLEIDFDKEAFSKSAREYYRELLESLFEDDEDDDGPDEPPSPGGGTPPKAPSPSTPGSPALFKDFDAPAGAFQLRTVDYEPEGRIDEASTDFTDDPRRLATKFTLNDLITAFTEALIGRPDGNAMQDILNANVDDNGDLPDLADLADVADTNAPRASANNASGAGALEFNAGEEFVQAEALYNAVYEAGGDPNRVIANAYDAVNGNRDNVQKLLDAQGGVSSPEDSQLIDDMTDEIRQIKDAAPDDDISAINKRSTPEKKFAGSLIENVPVDYDNPDYFDMDSDAYIPAQPEIDENGYTDNPEILALDYESADLIEQMLEGITDGSGVALLDFSDGDKYMEGVHEVPVEALRDALQMQGINTNEILFKLRDESNDMSEEPKPEQPSGLPEQISNQKIKDRNDGEFELNLVKIGNVYEGALISKKDNRVQIVVSSTSEREAKRVLKEVGDYIKQSANGDEAMYDSAIPNLDNTDSQAPVNRRRQAHSQMIKDLVEQTGNTIDDDTADKIRDAIDEEWSVNWSEATDDEIIEAIIEVAGPDIFGLPTPPAERRFLPTVREREAIENPTERPARENSEGFSPFSDIADQLDDSIDSELVENLDKSANAIVDFFGANIEGASFLAFDTSSGEIVVRSSDSRIFKVKPNGIVTDVNIDASTAEAFYAETGSAFGWERVPEDAVDAIFAESIRRYPDTARESAPATSEAPADPASQAPVFTYPGPREAGYTANNTTIASDGAVIGAGSIVIANRDGKRGVVVSIQNDPEYARIRFDDGKIAVRSANQIKAVSNPDGTLAMLPSGAAQPSGATPSTDVESRLDAPVRPTPNIARTGNAWGVNDTSDVPDFIQPLVRENAPQSEFAAWGERDAEIAKAASTRATLDSLLAAVDKYEAARERGEESSVLRALKEETNKILKDIYGGRDGVSFGVDGYTINVAGNYSSVSTRTPDNGRPTKSYSLSISFYINDKNGRVVGEGSRSIAIEDSTDENGNRVRKSSVKNEILKVQGSNKKKGFASAYNRYMENWYIANGIDKVKVYAAGGGNWQGAFVWALNGFDWENPETARSMTSALSRAAKTPEEREIAKKLADKVDAANGDPNKVPTPLEIALAGWYPGAKKWFGKDVIIERTWSGIKHLNPTAREQIQSVNYNQIKNAERRIQAGQNKPGISALGLAQIADNSFQTNNPELGPHIDQIRDALKNNRPLAFLSPAAKSALGKFVSKELLNKNSSMPLEDLFRLRTALDSEYRAENDYSNPFGAIEDALAGFTIDDFSRNSDELRAAGFNSKSLTGDDSGVNSTFMVTHEASGQVLFVKEEKLSRSWYGSRGLTAEVEANTIMNALEMMGVPSVRGSRADKDIIIMSQAGATLPLAAPVENASTMMRYGITDAEGDIYASDSSGNFVDELRSPEDVFSMAIVDMLGAGGDRHDANWMAAFDKTDNRLFMFPIDNSLLTVSRSTSGVEDFFISTWPDAGDVYQQAVPRIIRNAGEERAAEIFMNQVRKLITNLDNPLFQPKGEELAALIDKWGTYDAFKDALKERLTTIVTPGSAENKALINSMNISNWR